MKLHLRFLSAVLLVGLIGSALAQTSNPRVNFKETRLANGLRVITVEDHNAPVVAVNVSYNVGSRNERPGRTGFAHLFEHMMFQGSENVGKAITAEDVRRVAMKYIDINHLQIVAVGDASKTREVLAKFGSVQEYDGDGKPVRTASAGGQ